MADRERRPLGSPPLGIPDIGWIEGRIAILTSFLENTKWTLWGAGGLTTAFQVVCTLSMVAKVTGRFRVRSTGYITSDDVGGHVVAGVSTGAASIIPVFQQVSLNVPPSTIEGLDQTATVAMIADLPASGFTAAVGSTSIINFIMKADVNGHLALITDAGEFEVQEY